MARKSPPSPIPVAVTDRPWPWYAERHSIAQWPDAWFVGDRLSRSLPGGSGFSCLFYTRMREKDVGPMASGPRGSLNIGR